MPRCGDVAWMSRGCRADFAPITGLVDVSCLATASVTYLSRAVCVLCRPKISCARCILGSRKQYKYEVHRSFRSSSFCALRAALLTATRTAVRQQPAWPAADSFIDFKLAVSALESKFWSPAASCGILLLSSCSYTRSSDPLDPICILAYVFATTRFH